MSENDHKVTSADVYLMGKGEWYRSFDKMGAHPAVVCGQAGFTFCVWAPDVRSVHVEGDFNAWNIQADALERLETGGLWYGFVPGAQEGQLYKYVIETTDGERLHKADPYAFGSECPPGTASRLAILGGYDWGDDAWMGARRATDHMKSPLNIYEVHLGSWKRHDDGLEGNGFEPPEGEEAGGTYLSYDELSHELVDYVGRMGYTHVELLPVMEHPFDGSWGYQVTGYYAPTSRYGTPDRFMHFVDACHQAGIGVILDWVPGGFCRDAHGLVRFNGSKLYEKEEHPDWGTYKFDLSRGEVRSFLISNALYWLETYHADGIRMDGVTSMLYLNFGIDDPTKKRFNEKGGEEDLTAIEFVQKTNSVIGQYFPDVMMIAEESTAWPLVTYPPKEGGLGFHYKWDMGWMNDTLHYMQTDFPFRPGNHKLLTFSMMYAFNENFVLPLSHDEVVHGKCSLIGRMPGDWWRQFAGMRILAFYQIMHPGAKLSFMGNEFAQFIEWRYYESLQWFLTDQYDTHRHQQEFVAALNAFYRGEPALWQEGYSWDGFSWLDADDSAQSFVSFVRHGDNPADDLVILLNFDVAAREGFRVGVPAPGVWREAFSTDRTEFGGSGVLNEGPIPSEAVCWNGQDDSVTLRVPPLGGCVLKRVADAPAPGHATHKASTVRRKATSRTAASGEKKTTKTGAPKKDAKPARASKPAKTTARPPRASKATKAATTEKSAKAAKTKKAKKASKPTAAARKTD
jgi:1,4-alpha-glucan branching enzyme